MKMHKYTISGKIGEGAHGLVLKALDKSSAIPRAVALKRILLKRIDDGIPISVLREVKTLQRLKHPYVSFKIFNILIYLSYFFMHHLLKPKSF